MEVLIKSHNSISRLEMRQNPISFAEHSELWLVTLKLWILIVQDNTRGVQGYNSHYSFQSQNLSNPCVLNALSGTNTYT